MTRTTVTDVEGLLNQFGLDSMQFRYDYALNSDHYRIKGITHADFDCSVIKKRTDDLFSIIKGNKSLNVGELPDEDRHLLTFTLETEWKLQGNCWSSNTDIIKCLEIPYRNQKDGRLSTLMIYCKDVQLKLHNYWCYQTRPKRPLSGAWASVGNFNKCNDPPKVRMDHKTQGLLTPSEFNLTIQTIISGHKCTNKKVHKRSAHDRQNKRIDDSTEHKHIIDITGLQDAYELNRKRDTAPMQVLKDILYFNTAFNNPLFRCCLRRRLQRAREGDCTPCLLSFHSLCSRVLTPCTGVSSAMTDLL